ncbi:MAG: protein kinase domain-containing protein, partial [Isosphaeraceae bacterium]
MARRKSRSTPSSEVVVVQGQARFDRLRDGLRQLAEGVAALHEAGWLHRDLKPSNVLVTPEGRVVILDFGLGAELERGGLHHTSSTSLLGTAAYMSPEQAAGRTVTPASDWYSVGVILYEALTGRLPFVGGALDMLMEKQRLDPTPPGKVMAELPDDLDELCSALLRRDFDARPQAADILRSLQSWTPGVRVPASPRNAARTPRHLVGREHHLSVLSDAYCAMRQDGPVLVLVHGPSGVGKTALVERFLEALPADDGAVVLPGRCHAQESVPYKALDGVIDALGQALRRLSPVEVEAVLPRDFPYLCQVFPTLQLVEEGGGPRRRLQEIADPREQRKRCVAALRDLLGRLGDRRSLVVIIDDLHWGDQESASLLVDLLQPPNPPALLLIGCYRRADALSSPFLARVLGALGP